MLAIQHKDTSRSMRIYISVFVGLIVLAGLYVVALFTAPLASALFAMQPIDVRQLPAPDKTGNRVIIPRLGINIAYEKGTGALDRGAEWRSPTSGNPADGGNFVLSAYRLNIQSTPQRTIEQSPFYSINKLASGDKIIVDYLGKRYGYEVTKAFTVQPQQIEIEARTTDPILTLYSSSAGKTEDTRFIVQAKRLGEVALVTK